MRVLPKKMTANKRFVIYNGLIMNLELANVLVFYILIQDGGFFKFQIFL